MNYCSKDGVGSVDEEQFPSMVRVSLGSAIILGLTRGILNAKPTTIYLMTYHSGKCSANCVFCSQARSSTSKANMLSRVTWPVFPLETVINRIKRIERKGLVKRICLQTMNYPRMFEEALSLILKIHSYSNLPISISCQPLNSERIQKLADAGIDRIGIPLDASTEALFKRVKGSLAKGPYVWKRHIEALKSTVKILGRGRVTTHLIVGLGERDDELIEIIQEMIDIGVYPSLFAFTPIPGTDLEKKPQPSIQRYRRIQLAHYLMTNGKAECRDVVFDEGGHILGFSLEEDLLRETIKTGFPFMTSGCPGCNRPYYNERPSGPLYNYPFRPDAGEAAEMERRIIGGK